MNPSGTEMNYSASRSSLSGLSGCLRSISGFPGTEPDQEQVCCFPHIPTAQMERRTWEHQQRGSDRGEKVPGCELRSIIRLLLLISFLELWQLGALITEIKGKKNLIAIHEMIYKISKWHCAFGHGRRSYFFSYSQKKERTKKEWICQKNLLMSCWRQLSRGTDDLPG